MHFPFFFSFTLLSSLFFIFLGSFKRLLCESERVSCSVGSEVWGSMDCTPRGFYVHGILRPWDSPGKSTGVGCHSLLQGNFQTQGSNTGHLNCRQILYHMSHQGNPFQNSQNSVKYGLFLEFLEFYKYGKFLDLSKYMNLRINQISKESASLRMTFFFFLLQLGMKIANCSLYLCKAPETGRVPPRISALQSGISTTCIHENPLEPDQTQIHLKRSCEGYSFVKDA